MEYVLNKTPIKTTNKDSVNAFVIDTTFPAMKEISTYKIDETYSEDISTFESKIGVSFAKSKDIKIDIVKDTLIECDIKDILVDQITLNICKNANVNIVYKSKEKIDHHMKLVINGNHDALINIINLAHHKSRSLLAIEAYVSSNVVINLVDLVDIRLRIADN